MGRGIQLEARDGDEPTATAPCVPACTRAWRWGCPPLSSSGANFCLACTCARPNAPKGKEGVVIAMGPLQLYVVRCEATLV